jgi:hypothetical protein
MFEKNATRSNFFDKLANSAGHMFQKVAQSSPLKNLAQSASVVARKVGNTLERAVPQAARTAAAILPQYAPGIMGASATAQALGRGILGARKSILGGK